MYLAARDDPDVEVISWQGVGGKSYFTVDVQLRLPSGDRKAVDLIVLLEGTVWLIEAKASHAESRAEDEPKLSAIRAALSDDDIIAQIMTRTRRNYGAGRVEFAVAYSTGGAEPGCVSWIRHIAWEELTSLVEESGFAAVLQ
jgi:hypothetical protein